MSIYADSSAVVKRYADEEHADRVRALTTLVVSSITRVEVVAALWRKSRTGALTAADVVTLSDQFAAEWGDEARFVPVVVGPPVLDETIKLVARHGLRAYDGVQLACATAARRADQGVNTFACFDGELNEAAAREGFRLLDP